MAIIITIGTEFESYFMNLYFIGYDNTVPIVNFLFPTS